ncbi:FAD-dependent oxidoreductase [Pigmentiphaga sp. H8]|uniref:FAD-dependent oxidoreductase n=1 Tax=unclassified Pigmentiphaga TaxID=2626614 RepID=UPI000F5AA42A|nr:FAD-dependent oxidoreductase [Pigmentiphaga sp. H8]AZG10703.1 FAD-dependent oxidoreductase [Pigmentiphaga sp. H8]
MAQQLNQAHYDVVVLGGGAAGVAAAAAAARNGRKTLIIEANPILGGELLSGMSLDGVLNARGEYVVGGISDELFDECKRMNGFIGPVHDHRLICYVCVDPEIMKIAVMRVLDRHGVTAWVNSFAEDVVVRDGVVTGLVVVNKSGRTLVTADHFLDCSGDGDLAARAGAPFEMSDDSGDLQPVSLMFRVGNVDSATLLRFARENPASMAVGESDYIRGDKTDEQLLDLLVEQGQPSVFFKSEGPFLGDAIRRGDLAPTALIMIQPTSAARKEVCVNATRVGGNIDGTDTAAVSATVGTLMEQVWQTYEFVKGHLPGFENSVFAGLAPRVGVRETRRIMGDYLLTRDDVVSGRKQPDSAVAKGAQHVDIHQSGTTQIRIPIANGGSYDIPFGCLLPKGLKNVMVAGRCLSATREGMGTARTMGPCMAMGQAVGTAAAMCAERGDADVRALPVKELQARLRAQGGVIDGVY